MFTLILKETAAILLAALGGIGAIIIGPFDRTHEVFHWIARTHSRIVLKLFGITLVVKGGEYLEKGRSYVYVSNHASFFDIPATIIGVPDRVHIVYKKELELLPFFGWGLRLGRTYIPIDRGRGTKAAKSLEEAIRKIRNGASVLLFAEGTRTKDGKLQPFKRGAFSLAVKAGVPVVPLTINGSYNILPRHSYRVNPGPITLTIDKPIEIARNGDDKKTEMRLMEQVHQSLEKHYVEQ